MSWRSPNPHFRSAGELVDVKATFSRKRKSRGRPPENEGEGPSEHDSDGFSSPPPKQMEMEGGPSQNPNFEAAVETGAARTVADGEVPQEEDDDAMRVTTNPSSSDHQPPNFNSTESDGVFERRTSDRPNPIPPNPNREGQCDILVHTAKESWSRAFFGYEAKCDILVNNISECYNRVLLFAREKPLYGMLECIRMYLMDRFTSRWKMGARMTDCVGPKIRKKIEKLKGKVGDCMVREAGEWIYQVNTKYNEQFVVDLRDRTCSCRWWMLTGIPCQHAIAAIEMTNEEVDSFVATCYSKETFQKVYEPVIFPVQGPQLWPKTPYPDVVPPELTRLPGRPKGARQKTVEEQAEIRKEKTKEARHRVEVLDDVDGGKRMSRKGLMSEYTCRLCGEKCHNKRRCTQGIQLPQSKGPTTRKKRNRGEEGQSKCTLCHQPGHNRVTCSSAIADMYKDQEPASSSAPHPPKN